MSQQQQSNRRLVADDWDHHQLANVFVLETYVRLRTGSISGSDQGTRLCDQFRNVLIDLGETGIAQEVRGESHRVSRHQLSAFEQTEPCSSDSGNALQFVDGGLHNVAILLGSGDAGSDGLHGTKPSRCDTRLIEATRSMLVPAQFQPTEMQLRECGQKRRPRRCRVGRARASSHAAGSHRPRRARSRATDAVSRMIR